MTLGLGGDVGIVHMPFDKKSDRHVSPYEQHTARLFEHGIQTHLNMQQAFRPVCELRNSKRRELLLNNVEAEINTNIMVLDSAHAYSILRTSSKPHNHVGNSVD